MFRRSSLRWPILLSTVLFVLIIGLLVVWIIGQATTEQWALLTIGTIVFALLLVGFTVYMILTIKEIRLNQRQANFLDAVTHELKSPIASIKLYLQTLDMRQVDLDQQREFHRFMLEDVQRLDALIDDLLEVARLDHRRKGEPEETVDLGQVVQQSRDIVQRRYGLPPDAILLVMEPCWVQGRIHDLELIVLNLLDNAAKYGGSPLQVRVELTMKSQKRVLLRISDNGQGIPFEARRKIFQRFVRGGSELERTTQGTGLGLYLVRELLSKMKGRIHVHGRGPLRGATFDVELPGWPREPTVDPA